MKVPNPSCDLQYIVCIVGWSVEFFLYLLEQVKKSKVRYDLKVRIQNFGARLLVKVFIFKNSRGPKYYFFVKIGIKLLFILKNKLRKTNSKFEF